MPQLLCRLRPWGTILLGVGDFQRPVKSFTAATDWMGRPAATVDVGGIDYAVDDLGLGLGVVKDT